MKKAYIQGACDALAHLGLKHASEELRLKLPHRQFHGYDAAMKTEGVRAGKGVGKNAEDANMFAHVIDAMPTPTSPVDQLSARDPLDRNTSWGAPSNLSAGDAANRASDMGQPTAVGTAI